INSLSSGLFDLVLAGHTHGGQIFPFHLLTLQATPYLAGQYSVNGTELYVSRGASSWGPQMRLFAPTDITLIHLNKK
ncbi:MAG: metallophosphoesterase, partial [Alphaproteobacteria bacterium]|nr:metallophosphoesterase [Alphaproteobacteria bacterium]